ncbi:hypothetical protein IWX81_002726 [Salinibacterium sp. CAN_S4]|uniref:hypothetical protein n=1 Tax=Salinibacterium sp. CAN_S4 TaxID=2787727 RepID=UPI0018EF6B75
MAGGGLLRVDYGDLSLLEGRLTQIVSSMKSDNHTTSDLAAAVGDPRLAGKITEFGDSWSVHRGQISEEIEWMRDKVREISDGFATTDGDLADGLKG